MEIGDYKLEFRLTYFLAANRTLHGDARTQAFNIRFDWFKGLTTVWAIKDYQANHQTFPSTILPNHYALDTALQKQAHHLWLSA